VVISQVLLGKCMPAVGVKDYTHVRRNLGDIEPAIKMVKNTLWGIDVRTTAL